MSFADKILDIPEKVIYLGLAILLIIPLLMPLGLPISITDTTQRYYEAVEALPAGTKLFIGFDAAAPTEMELGLPSHAVMNHIMKKEGLKIVVASSTADGPMFWEKTLDDIGGLEKYQRDYGTGYVYLGFIAGGETAVAALAADLEKATGGVDHYGTNFADLPLMQEVSDASDFDIIIMVNGPADNPKWWMQQWAVPYDLPYYTNPLGGVAASLWPFVEAGQISSMLVGAKGAAEYELLSSSPGRAIAGMDAQSLGHMYLFGLVLVANIVFVSKNLKGGQ